MELGFASHEYFTRTFKTTFGMTPEKYRKNPLQLNRMTKPELLLHYTLVDEGVPLIVDGIVLEVNRRQLTTLSNLLVLKKRCLYSSWKVWEQSLVLILWTRFGGIFKKKEDKLLSSSDAAEIGVAHPCADTGYFLYFAEAKTDKANIPNGYTGWEEASKFIHILSGARAASKAIHPECVVPL